MWSLVIRLVTVATPYFERRRYGLASNQNNIGGLILDQISPEPEQSSSIESSGSESGSSETSSSLVSSSTSSSDSGSPESSSISAPGPRSNNEKLEHRPGAKAASGNSANDAQHSPVQKPPGLGRRQTQKRNQRRRESKKLQHLKRIGILPPNATRSDLLEQKPPSELSDPGTLEIPKSNDTNLNSIVSERQSKSEGTTASKPLDAPRGEELNTSAEFEARRQLLLDSIASGGVEVEPSTKADRASVVADGQDHVSLDVAAPDLETPTISATEKDGTNAAAAHADQEDTMQVSHISKVENDHLKALESSRPSQATVVDSQLPRRRAKLDIASSRRLLFGSLGLRTPKTKKDEDKMREKLKENIRPVPQSHNNSTDLSVANLKGNSPDGDDNWKDKIILKAVECCYDGVELSTPPFPFIQRWDPQQQGRSKTSSGGLGMGRGKKRKRNRTYAQDEDTMQYEDYGTLVEQQEHGNDNTDTNGIDNDQEQVIHQTPSDEYQGAVDEQLMRDAHDISAAPANQSAPLNGPSSIQADFSSCTSLLKDLAVPGAVIAFKQLEMSQETSWQPQVSTYRTAVIDRILENQRFEMTLAQQDRPSTKAKLYDEKTGQRIYSKFEIPDNESEDIQGDDGFIELSFEELIEPKLIRPAEDALEQQSPQDFQPIVETVDLSNMVDADENLQSPNENDREENAELPEDWVKDNGGNLPYQERVETPIDQVGQRGGFVELTEETRKEISILIKDAGFRSDVHSDVDRELEKHLLANHSNQPVTQDDSYPALSPKFNGFSSSPPAEQGSKPMSDTLDSTRVTPSNLEQDDFDLPEISSPIQLQSRQEIEDGFVNGQDMSNSLYEEDDIRNDFSSDPSKKFNFDQTTLPERLFSHPSPPPRNSQSTGKAKTIQSAHAPTRTGGLDGVNSDSLDEFPVTEEVVSTAKSRVALTLSDDEDDFPVISSQRARVKKSKLSGSQSQLQAQSQSQSQRTKRSFSIADVLASSNDGDSDFETMSTPRASQIPVGSQVVDLTVSSDAVDPEDSEYEDRGAAKGLPAGPGWIKKTRNGRRSEAAGGRKGQKGEGRKTRSM